MAVTHLEEAEDRCSVDERTEHDEDNGGRFGGR
jgi:hypothetical protein